MRHPYRNRVEGRAGRPDRSNDQAHDLRERDYGDLTGLNKAETAEKTGMSRCISVALRRHHPAVKTGNGRETVCGRILKNTSSHYWMMAKVQSLRRASGILINDVEGLKAIKKP